MCSLKWFENSLFSLPIWTLESLLTNQTKLTMSSPLLGSQSPIWKHAFRNNTIKKKHDINQLHKPKGKKWSEQGHSFFSVFIVDDLTDCLIFLIPWLTHSNGLEQRTIRQSNHFFLKSLFMEVFMTAIELIKYWITNVLFIWNFFLE